MELNKLSIFFALLRSALDGTLFNEQEKAAYTEDVIAELLKLSRKHDLSHLLEVGIEKNNLPTEKSAELSKAIMVAVYRYEQLDYELGELCDAFEAEGIDFIPLKGSVIRRYYPEAWMRTSCDIDILVREADLDRAADLLAEKRGYTPVKKGSHDISLFLNDIVHLELHYTLSTDGVNEAAASVLNDVWARAALVSKKKHWYEMSDAMFYFHHVAHMARHFENGGCGIRPFIDLWILDALKDADRDARDKMLTDGELLKFAQVARKLSRVWFEGEEHDSVSNQMQDFVLRGGVYGTSETRIALQQQKKGGRMGYALSKIFIPYDVIKYHYPILQKHRWLTPFMEVRRWCKLIFCGHLKRTVKELKYSQDISADKAAETKKFLSSIGLC